MSCLWVAKSRALQGVRAVCQGSPVCGGPALWAAAWDGVVARSPRVSLCFVLPCSSYSGLALVICVFK